MLFIIIFGRLSFPITCLDEQLNRLVSLLTAVKSVSALVAGNHRECYM